MVPAQNIILYWVLGQAWALPPSTSLWLQTVLSRVRKNCEALNKSCNFDNFGDNMEINCNQFN